MIFLNIIFLFVYNDLQIFVFAESLNEVRVEVLKTETRYSLVLVYSEIN